jgi:hypothetical protein
MYLVVSLLPDPFSLGAAIRFNPFTIKRGARSKVIGDGKSANPTGLRSKV